MHKYKNLDGLRGIAAAIVVLTHFSNSFWPSLQGWHNPDPHATAYDRLVYATPLHLIFAGDAAVCLFFVLSGFVLSQKFFQTRDNQVIVSSAVRRYFRLAIPAASSIVLTCLVLQLGGIQSHHTPNVLHSPSWLATFWNYPGNLLQAIVQGFYGTFFKGLFYYNPVLWTMQYELYGSFMIFMFLALFGKLPRRWIFYAVFCALFAKTPYLAFLLGVIISDIWVNYPKIRDSLSGTATTVGFFTGGIALLSWYTAPAYRTFYSAFNLPGLNQGELGRIILTVGACLLIIAILNSRLLTSGLEKKIPQFLGRISFSLYLTHLVVLGSFASWIFNMLMQHHGYIGSILVTFACFVPPCILVAVLFTKYVDEQSISFSRIVGNYLMSAGTPASHKTKTATTAPVVAVSTQEA